MTDMNLLVWLTQLGLGVALPLGGIVYLCLWLRKRFDLGIWIILVGAVFGIACAAHNLYTSLKALGQMTKNKKKDDDPPPSVSYNDHD